MQFRIYGLLYIHGGTPQTTVATLSHPGRLDTVAPLVAEVDNVEARWLGQKAK